MVTNIGTPKPHHLRSLYRSLLRELPPRPSPASATISSSTTTRTQPSPLHLRLRQSFSQPAAPNSPSTLPQQQQQQRIQETHQFLQYIRAQRMYATLLERYNPGLGFLSGEDGEEERVRLTARRVGMEMPREWYEKDGDGGGR